MVPVAPRSPPVLDLSTPGTRGQAVGQDVFFVAQRLNVAGAQVYAASDLQKTAGFEPGREISLRQLHEMAEKITQRYRQDGYLVARAYVPTQEIQDGTVTIAVLEGRYGQVALNNTSSLDRTVASQLLQGLESGDPIEREPLQERLLRLSDVPGVDVRSVLVPGASVGLSDLIVQVKPGAPVSGSVDIDNAGNRYTGEHRLGGTLHWNNPTGRGDVLSLRALTSGSGLQYGRVSYQTQVGMIRAGLAYSELRYALGREFQALGANGRARTASLFGSYPWVRSHQRNWTLGVSLDAKDFEDRLDVLPLRTDKTAQVATASLTGDHRDSWWGGGLSHFSLAWSTGRVAIRSPIANALDAQTAQTDGNYNKLVFGASRLQVLTESVALLAAFNGQVASRNLDVSEKMMLGGMHSVRAYPEGEAFADEGVMLTLEARKQITVPVSVTGQIHLAAFVDAGALKLNHSPWAEGDNFRHLSGAGVGVYWTHARDFSIKAVYARKLGREDAVSAPDKTGRFWVQAVKYF